MSRLEIKQFVTILVLSSVFLFVGFGLAQEYSSPSFIVSDPVISAGLESSSSSNFGLGQSAGQNVIGKSTSASYQLWSGFQYFFQVDANTLTATAGDGQVSLSWTVPSTFLGVVVGDYDIGVGTVSGSYTFENVGNVTSFVKTGLSNGTIYYFIVKAKTTAGTFLVFSNEASASPAGSGTSPTQGSSGSSTALYARLELNGLTFPNALVTILRNGQITGSTTSNTNGEFEFVLEDLSSGRQSFGVYAIDVNGTKTATYNFIKNLAAGVTESESDIFLSPTILPSHASIKQGETITFSGFTAPTANVRVYFDNVFFTEVNAGSEGSWRNQLNTQNYTLGTHNIIVEATKGELKSGQATFYFEITENESVPYAPGQSVRSDLNNDGRVNLVDFSILLYYWQQALTEPVRADLNRSGMVDFKDFSIMMYDWTG